MTLDQFNDIALSVPFVIHGRDYNGWDCWGLIFCAYRDVFADPIESFRHDYTSSVEYAELSALIEAKKTAWISVDVPTEGDVGLYRITKYPCHVALVLPRGRMLHCEKRLGTISEPLDNLIWRNRNVGFFRRQR